MTRPSPPSWLSIEPSVRAALAAGEPVVALESNLITHGLPRPLNLEAARRMEAEVRSGGAVPATVAVLKGVVHLGLADEALERLAQAEEVHKLSRRDLGDAVAGGHTGGTTVASTMFIAHAGGVAIFATGGIGGVHRGGTGDVSADLTELARTPVAVVSSGAKAILDLPRTLEWLEMAGVPVIGWQTDEFPAFFTAGSGLPVSGRADSAAQAAAILGSQWELGLTHGALICVPCPEEAALAEKVVEQALAEAERQAAARGVQGKDLTPFLLGRLAETTKGATLQANLALLMQNARVAAEIAAALPDWQARRT